MKSSQLEALIYYIDAAIQAESAKNSSDSGLLESVEKDKAEKELREAFEWDNDYYHD